MDDNNEGSEGFGLRLMKNLLNGLYSAEYLIDRIENANRNSSESTQNRLNHNSSELTQNRSNHNSSQLTQNRSNHNSSQLTQNRSRESNYNSNKKCGLCYTEFEIKLSRLDKTSLICLMCKNYYHQDCLPSIVLDLQNTKTCPKCETKSLEKPFITPISSFRFD